MPPPAAARAAQRAARTAAVAAAAAAAVPAAAALAAAGGAAATAVPTLGGLQVHMRNQIVNRQQWWQCGGQAVEQKCGRQAAALTGGKQAAAAAALTQGPALLLLAALRHPGPYIAAGHGHPPRAGCPRQCCPSRPMLLLQQGRLHVGLGRLGSCASALAAANDGWD